MEINPASASRDVVRRTIRFDPPDLWDCLQVLAEAHSCDPSHVVGCLLKEVLPSRTWAEWHALLGSCSMADMIECDLEQHGDS
jgi:hypothetical protein